MQDATVDHGLHIRHCRRDARICFVRFQNTFALEKRFLKFALELIRHLPGLTVLE